MELALKILLMFVLAPFWLPVVRKLAADAMAITRPPERERKSVTRQRNAFAKLRSFEPGSPRRSDRRTHQLDAREGGAWTRARLTNPAWDSGRRVRPDRSREPAIRPRTFGGRRLHPWHGAYKRSA